MKGRIDKVKQVKYVKVKEVEFIPDDKSYYMQADGELYKDVPLKAKIVENKLKFYCTD